MKTVPRDNILVLDQLEGRTAGASLVDSIQANGILNPLKVYKHTLEESPLKGAAQLMVSRRVYVILDGHRRLSAADELELTEIPIEIMDKPADETKARTIQIILNRNRQDVKPTHVAGAIAALKEAGETQKKIGKTFALSAPEVSMYLTLERGHEKLRKAVNSGRISLSAVEPLLTKPLEVQAELADTAIRQRTVRAVRALIKTHQMQTDINAPTSQLEEDIDPLEYLVLEEIQQATDAVEALTKQNVESSTISTAIGQQVMRLQWLIPVLERQYLNDE